MKRRTVLSERQLRRIVRQLIRENDVGMYPAIPSISQELSDKGETGPEESVSDKDMRVWMYPAVPPPDSDTNAAIYPAVGSRQVDA